MGGWHEVKWDPGRSMTMALSKRKASWQLWYNFRSLKEKSGSPPAACIKVTSLLLCICAFSFGVSSTYSLLASGASDRSDGGDGVKWKFYGTPSSRRCRTIRQETAELCPFYRSEIITFSMLCLCPGTATPPLSDALLRGSEIRLAIYEIAKL